MVRIEIVCETAAEARAEMAYLSASGPFDLKAVVGIVAEHLAKAPPAVPENRFIKMRDDEPVAQWNASISEPAVAETAPPVEPPPAAEAPKRRGRKPAAEAPKQEPAPAPEPVAAPPVPTPEVAAQDAADEAAEDAAKEAEKAPTPPPPPAKAATVEALREALSTYRDRYGFEAMRQDGTALFKALFPNVPDMTASKVPPDRLGEIIDAVKAMTAENPHKREVLQP